MGIVLEASDSLWSPGLESNWWIAFVPVVPARQLRGSPGSGQGVHGWGTPECARGHPAGRRLTGLTRVSRPFTGKQPMPPPGVGGEAWRELMRSLAHVELGP